MLQHLQACFTVAIRWIYADFCWTKCSGKCPSGATGPSAQVNVPLGLLDHVLRQMSLCGCKNKLESILWQTAFCLQLSELDESGMVVNISFHQSRQRLIRIHIQIKYICYLNTYTYVFGLSDSIYTVCMHICMVCQTLYIEYIYIYVWFAKHYI